MMNRPNVIYILADDMGYGDMRCNNAESRIPTPNLDRLAAQGMRFTDAHAGSSVCTPSRYNVLTGRYCWRSRLKRGIVWEWDAPLIEPERQTVAHLLQNHGYHTACIGKWHLGWDWPTVDGRAPNETLPFGQSDKTNRADREAFGERIDYAERIGGGPVDRGFDSYFGVDVPNFPPYAWFENDRLTQMPTEQKPDEMYGRPGKAVPGWSLEKMIPEFTRRAVELIESSVNADGAQASPYFLYFPLTSPHSPIVPNEPFHDVSGCGRYGDFVCEVDWVVGQVLDALQRTGTADNTLLIFTSDNGPERGVADDIGVYDRAQQFGHYSMGPWRGIKRDAWEGGHRVPFIAHWPAVTPANTRCDQPVCLGDFIATCADMLGASLDDGAGEDSVSMLPLLKGRTDRPTRRSVVHHSASGKLAIRQDRWVYIDAPSGGDNEEPGWYREARGYKSHDQPAELFDLQDDPMERENRYAERGDVAKALAAELEQIKAAHGAAARANPSDNSPIEN